MENLYKIPKKNIIFGLVFLFFSCSQVEPLNNDSLTNNSQSLTGKIGPQTLAHTKEYPSDVATAWFNLLTDITRTKPYFVGQANRIFTYSGIALYESVVPGMPSYQSMYSYLTGKIIESGKKKDYYWPACANAAIARISSKIMQTYPTPNLAQVQALEASFNSSFQSQVTPEQLQASNDFGKYVADIIFEWSKTDGVFNPDGTPVFCPPYVPLGGLGNWVPTPPAFLSAVGQCPPKTFVPNIGNTVLASPHPAYSTDPSSVFYQAANQVYQRRNNITSQEMKSFSNWRDLSPNYNPIAHMLKITTQIFIKEKLNLEDASVLYAKQTIAAYDAVSAVFQSKFHYALLRPVTYIRGVMGQNNWSSFGTTPQTPSYPDELSVTASTVEILENRFGTNYAVTDSVHKSTHGIFSYPSLNALVLDEVEARVSGGTIFRFCGEEGVVQGRKVGQMVNALPFKKP
ncbi:phosphatase PAP2 family protein [Flavobacterium gilvum]|uniref:Vanadium-dependent haloperoxidase n=1 Tax=Flavobacterium gilvum TaxID=1492737 RepID=A0AAC9I5I9_9FLAO|nr:hypothetical protein [Flavobacterium gilvum]AOW09982.1 hypothetical protein EM308_10935 [Flavobacterium gilvum]KFC58005.1 hypothetical protein FEM08_32150 [Flavobacterium gilvum]